MKEGSEADLKEEELEGTREADLEEGMEDLEEVSEDNVTLTNLKKSLSKVEIEEKVLIFLTNFLTLDKCTCCCFVKSNFVKGH
jgi:hypothetical protein